MNKELAHFFWEGKITNLELAAIRSFINHGFEVHVWSYNGLQVEGAISKDAGELLPKNYIDNLNVDGSVLSFPESGRLSILAGILRLEIVNKFNGWWFDTDCFCLKDQTEFKKLRKDLKFYTVAEDIIDGNPRFASGMFYAQGDYASELLAQGHNVLNSSKKYKWGNVGPDLFTRFANEKCLVSQLGTTDISYSISYRNIELFLDPQQISHGLRKIKKSHVTHIWNAHLVNTYKIDKNNLPKGSLLEYLYTNSDC